MRTLKLTFVVCFLVLGTTMVHAAEEAALFAQGNAAYRDGRYDEAVRKYEQAAESGRVSGALYYNLANSYYKEGKLGPAILNYERARRYIPRDSDLQANVRFAASKAPSMENGEHTLWQKAVDKHLEFYTINETLWILLVLGTTLAAVHLSSLYFAWPSGRRRWTLGILGAVCLIYLGGFLIQFDRQASQAVAVSPTVARFEPRNEATAHFDVHEGSRVRIRKSSDGWWKIERPDGKKGWVEKASIEKI